MNVLIILVLLAVLTAIGWSVIALNRFGQERFQYHPFSITNTAVLALSIVLCAWSTEMLPSGSTMESVRVGLLSFQLAYEDSDFVVMVVLGVLLAIGVLINIARKTSIPIAIYATTLQLIAAAFLIVMILALLVMRNSREKQRRR